MRTSRSSGILRRSRAHKRAFRRATGGSVHILETMIVGIMVVGAVVAVATLNVPVSQTEGFKTSQERLVQDALDTLAAQPSQDASEVIFDALLEEYVMKAVAGQKSPLMDYLNRTLPAGSQYNVFLDTGFGRPLPVIEGGSPPGESMTGARSFVPKMSYVFMIPEFQRYHGDFHMNVLAIPMHNSIIQRDEGVPVELAVTFENSDGESFTQRTFGETALRYNDPEERSWASTSIYTPDGENPSYFLDASNAPVSDLTELNLDGLIETLNGDAYNVTVPLAIEESAGHPIPRGAKVSVEFPRGWEFAPSARSWMESELTEWSDFQWDGGVGTGWTVSAHLKNPVKSDTVYFNLTGDYVLLTDSSYPHFHPVVAWMGDGAQGKSTILVDIPQDLDVGGYRRDTFLSLAKPMIAHETSTWGMSFANMGMDVDGSVTIKSVELRQPDGISLMSDVKTADGWIPGNWEKQGSGHYLWTPGAAANVDVGEAAWLSMDVKGGPTRDNHYRNHDYQELLYHFSPANTTSGGSNDWSFTQRAHQMGAESVYRNMVPPYEAELLWMEEWPGWPDQAASYWFGAEAQQQNRLAVGNSTYDVGANSLLSQAFGDYQGDHVFSEIDLTDPNGDPQRRYELGDRVHIHNDFSALFGTLGSVDGGDVSISDIKIKSSVFTPDKAWTGEPTKVFEQSAGVDYTTGSFHWLESYDMTDNGVLDVIAVDSSGLVYGLDGRDGAKLWQMDVEKSVSQATLSDVDDDNEKELVLAHKDNTLSAHRLGLDLSADERLVWNLDVDSDGLGLDLLELNTHEVTAILDLSEQAGSLDDPVIAVAVSSKTGGGHVSLIRTVEDGDGFDAEISATHTSDNTFDTNTVIGGLAPMEHSPENGPTEHYLAVASMNQTVAAYSLPDLELHWITRLPERALRLSAADLTGDGWDDLVVNTAKLHEEENDDSVGGGDAVFVLPGRSGHFGPGLRSVDDLLPADNPSLDAAILSNGWTAVTADDKNVLQDYNGLYAPVSDIPTVGSCDLEEAIGEVNVGLKMMEPEDILAWLDDQQWTGVHTDLTTPEEILFIVSRDGAVLKAVDTCGENRLRWSVVSWDSEFGEGIFTDLHTYKPDTDDEAMYRMAETGVIEHNTGSSDWEEVADACSMAQIDCTQDVEVNQWSVQEDSSGRAERFWAAVQVTDPDDGNVTEGHLVSIHADDLGSDAWESHYSAVGERLHALEVQSDGELWLGGGTGQGGLLMMHRAGDGEPLEPQRVFYANSTEEHGGAILGVSSSEAGDWALDQDGQMWRRASQDTWVPYATWREDTQSGTFAVDPEGTTWAFMDDFIHMPLRTHVQQAEVRLPTIELDGTAGPDDELWVRIESAEAHITKNDGAQRVTDVKWYARPAGNSQWTPLASSGWIKNALGLGTSQHEDRVALETATSAIDVKAVLVTRTLDGSQGTLVQDPGATPLLQDADVQVTLWHPAGEGYADTYVPAADMTSDADASYNERLQGHTLAQEDPLWSYRGGMNLEVQLSEVSSRHNRLVDVGEQLTSDSAGPSVAIADRSDAYLHWWVLEGDTGVPERPSTGQIGVNGEKNLLFDLLVGDLTGDGVDNMALLGDFQVPGDPGPLDSITGGEPDATYQGLIWDTERDRWQFIESDENHIIPAAVLTGPYQGRQTLAFSVPTASFYLFVDGLGFEEEEPNFVTSFFGPRYHADDEEYDAPELRWGTNPLESQGHSTFSYEIPFNSLFGTSIVMSEMTFDLSVDGSTVTQTARLLDWFDILPPGRTQSVPPVYTVEVVAWFDEGYGRVENQGSDGDGGGGSGGGGLDVIPDTNFNNVS